MVNESGKAFSHVAFEKRNNALMTGFCLNELLMFART
jgi:hypothetical protein